MPETIKRGEMKIWNCIARDVDGGIRADFAIYGRDFYEAEHEALKRLRCFDWVKTFKVEQGSAQTGRNQRANRHPAR